MPITFPVLRRLEVEGYELFQTSTSSGIQHDFTKGVHVIAGINGLGKTTLLNILYRLMLGPLDMSKEDSGLASTQHRLSQWRNKKYFKDRVRDVRGARATAIISFGGRRLSVTRGLQTLEVERLVLDGVPEEVSSQARFEELVCELTGASSYFDYFAILRFLIFFLEDRPELIWDRRSQFDMFRLLFYDLNDAKAAAEEYDKAQALDSTYRNERVPIRAAREQLDIWEAAESSGLATELRVARAALSAAQSQDEENSQAVNEARQDLEALRLRREKARLDLEEARLAYEEEQQLFYQGVFPDLAGTAAHVFLNLATGGGCLVCGNQSAAASERLTEYAARHQCPVCESLPEQQENVVSAAEFNEKRLAKVAAQVDTLRGSVAELEADVAAHNSNLLELIEAREDTVADVQTFQRRLKELQRQVAETDLETILSDDEDQIAFKRRYVEEGEQRLAALLADRTAAEARYSAIKERQSSRLAEKLKEVKERFTRISRKLLAETCALREATDSRKIGQEGQTFEFPILEVMMSSGVFTGTLSPRAGASSVSESQREFIDLAFRMALIETAADKSSDAMLILETPEASLDSLFVMEAGALFRGFAAGGATLGNVFIASTNLNNEAMIPALFGASLSPEPQATSEADTDALTTDKPAARQEPPPILAPEQRKSHLINLLERSAPNAALRQNRSFYEDKLWEAVFMDVDEGERAALIAGPKDADGGEGGAGAEATAQPDTTDAPDTAS